MMPMTSMAWEDEASERCRLVRRWDEDDGVVEAVLTRGFTTEVDKLPAYQHTLSSIRV